MSAILYPTTTDATLCTLPIPRKVIRYDPLTGDFARFLNGELLGYAATHHTTEDHINEAAYHLLTASDRLEAQR